MNKKKRMIFFLKKVPRGTIQIFFLLLFSLNIIAPLSVNAEFYYPELAAQSDLLMDADSGIIYIDNNIDEQKGIASLTKLMTVYVLADEMKEQGKKKTDEITISQRAAAIKLQNTDNSGVYLSTNEKMSIDEALKLTLVYSDNGVAVSLAENLSGSEQKHVDKMNDKAKELGMNNTIFYNVTGLTLTDYGDYILEGTNPTDYNKSSARDMGVLTKHLIKDYPEILEYTSLPSIEYDGYEYNTWNQMLPEQLQEYKGVKGLKTGTSIEAGECYIGYYQYKEKNYISIVLNADSEVYDRFEETKVMYDWINEESNRMIKLLDSETEAMDLYIPGSKNNNVNLYPNANLDILKEENIRIKEKEQNLNPEFFDDKGYLIKSIPEGEKVLTMTFSVPKDNIAMQTVEGNENEFEITLVAKEEIQKSGYIGKIPQAVKTFFNEFYKNIF